MSDPRFSTPVTRPAMCPVCKCKVVDTLAKVISATTMWRCRECDKTWSIAGLAASSRLR